MLLVLAPQGLFAQLTPAPAKVTKINLTNVGPQIVSEALVKANIRVKEGDMYNRAAIDDDVRNLYTTGYFYNVRVAEDRSADGVVLLYMLLARPVLTEIIFTGNKKYSRTQLFKKGF